MKQKGKFYIFLIKWNPAAYDLLVSTTISLYRQRSLGPACKMAPHFLIKHPLIRPLSLARWWSYEWGSTALIMVFITLQNSLTSCTFQVQTCRVSTYLLNYLHFYTTPFLPTCIYLFTASLLTGSPVGLKSKRFVFEILLARENRGEAPKEFRKQTFSILTQPESRLAGYFTACLPTFLPTNQKISLKENSLHEPKF